MSTRASVVSIIVPCFNYGHLLGDALNSVLAQSYEHWECIVVDDGSTDNTGEVCAAYCKSDSRFRYIRQENKGLAATRNTGLRHIKGDYVQLLDADDILPREKLESHTKLLDVQPGIDLVYGTVYNFYRDLSALPSATRIQMAPPQSGKGIPLINCLLDDNMFLAHCALFRSTAIGEIGMFEEDMITCEDWNFWFKFAIHGKSFLFVDDEKGRVFVRTHGSNMSGNRRNMWKGRVHFYKLAAKMIQELPVESSVRKTLLSKCVTLGEHFETRLKLAYGSPLAGIWSMGQSMLKGHASTRDVRDLLYWLRQRILKRV